MKRHYWKEPKEGLGVFHLLGCLALSTLLLLCDVASAQRPSYAPIPIPSPRVRVGAKLLGVLRVDLPFTVERNQPFYLDLWLQPVDPSFSESIEVFMEQTDKISYEPRVFKLKPGARQTVKALVLKSYSGLAEVIASATGWETLYVPISTGFSSKLRANHLSQAMESGSERSTTLDFIDAQGNPVPLDAPAKLVLQASKAKIRKQTTEEWSDRVEFELRRGASSTPMIYIKSESWSTETGMLLAEVRINDDFVVHSDQIQFGIVPRWWIPLLMSILGGGLHAAYQLLSKVGSITGSVGQWLYKTALPTSVSSVVGGILSYCLANWNVLGIKVDTTSLQGFVVLGFLFSYVGVDLILKTVLSKKG